MIAILFSKVYNWNETRDSFMKAYNEGIDKGLYYVHKTIVSLTN
jgi:hypothetical protein